MQRGSLTYDIYIQWSMLLYGLYNSNSNSNNNNNNNNNNNDDNNNNNNK